MDWHPEDIKAAVRKKGFTLAKLGAAGGVSRQNMANALVIPHEAAEQLIAAALDVPPSMIWPSRYHADGSRKRPQPPTNYHRMPRFAEAAA